MDTRMLGLYLAGAVHNITPSALDDLLFVASRKRLLILLRESESEIFPKSLFRTLDELKVDLTALLGSSVDKTDYATVYLFAAQVMVMTQSPARLEAFFQLWMESDKAEDWQKQLLELYEMLSRRSLDNLHFAFIEENNNPHGNFEALMREDQPTVKADEAATFEYNDWLAFQAPLRPELMDMPIEQLDLKQSVYNCLVRSQIRTIGKVLDISRGELLSLRNFGEKSFEELREKILRMIPGSRPVGQPADEE